MSPPQNAAAPPGGHRSEADTDGNGNEIKYAPQAPHKSTSRRQIRQLEVDAARRLYQPLEDAE